MATGKKNTKLESKRDSGKRMLLIARLVSVSKSKISRVTKSFRGESKESMVDFVIRDDNDIMFFMSEGDLVTLKEECE